MFTNLMVPVDTSEPSSWVKSLPAALALRKVSGARLILATILADIEELIEAAWTSTGYEDRVESARLKLIAVRDEFPEAADAQVEIGCGNVWREIVGLARRREVDLIVLASHRPALKDYLIGANAASVARHAPCSVMIVR